MIPGLSPRPAARATSTLLAGFDIRSELDVDGNQLAGKPSGQATDELLSQEVELAGVSGPDLCDQDTVCASNLDVPRIRVLVFEPGLGLVAPRPCPSLMGHLV